MRVERIERREITITGCSTPDEAYAASVAEQRTLHADGFTLTAGKVGPVERIGGPSSVFCARLDAVRTLK